MVAGLAFVVLTPIMLMTAVVVRFLTDEPSYFQNACLVVEAERLLATGSASLL